MELLIHQSFRQWEGQIEHVGGILTFQTTARKSHSSLLLLLNHTLHFCFYCFYWLNHKWIWAIPCHWVATAWQWVASIAITMEEGRLDLVVWTASSLFTEVRLLRQLCDRMPKRWTTVESLSRIDSSLLEYQNNVYCVHSSEMFFQGCWKWRCSLLYHVQFFATPWTVDHQGPLSLGFSK